MKTKITDKKIFQFEANRTTNTFSRINVLPYKLQQEKAQWHSHICIHHYSGIMSSIFPAKFNQNKQPFIPKLHFWGNFEEKAFTYKQFLSVWNRNSDSELWSVKETNLRACENGEERSNDVPLHLLLHTAKTVKLLTCTSRFVSGFDL